MIVPPVGTCLSNTTGPYLGGLNVRGDLLQSLSCFVKSQYADIAIAARELVKALPIPEKPSRQRRALHAALISHGVTLSHKRSNWVHTPNIRGVSRLVNGEHPELGSRPERADECQNQQRFRSE